MYTLLDGIKVIDLNFLKSNNKIIKQQVFLCKYISIIAFFVKFYKEVHTN